jgi:hypothetical protein
VLRVLSATACTLCFPLITCSRATGGIAGYAPARRHLPDGQEIVYRAVDRRLRCGFVSFACDSEFGSLASSVCQERIEHEGVGLK